VARNGNNPAKGPAVKPPALLLSGDPKYAALQQVTGFLRFAPGLQKIFRVNRYLKIAFGNSLTMSESRPFISVF
jgi:hypothetical protein